MRKQYAPDYIISDWVLAQGYAYASTDKGNSGTSFYNNGERSAPGQALQEWHARVTELTVAAKAVVAQRYGRRPDRTWMTGISNGGYLTRWQLENRPELYDGGVDWEGTLLTADGPNLLTYLPTALREYPQAAVDPAARQRMYDVGFEPGSEFLWPDHYAVYWDLTQRTYREAFDPEYDGATKAGTPFCRIGDRARHAARLRRGVRLRLAPAVGEGRRRLGVAHRRHRQADAHPARRPSTRCCPSRPTPTSTCEMIADAGKGAMHRYYVIEDGNHVDDRDDLFPTRDPADPALLPRGVPAADRPGSPPRPRRPASPSPGRPAPATSPTPAPSWRPRRAGTQDPRPP